MTSRDYVRIFFAIDLSLPDKTKIKKELDHIKNKSNPSEFRWTSPDDLHVTLQFLAQVRMEDIPTLCDSVRHQVIGKISPFYLRLGSVSYLPNTQSPKVIAIRILESKELFQLSYLVGLGLENRGYEIDRRPFYGHLTIARIKQAKPSLDFLLNFDLSHFAPIYVHQVTLFRSEPSTNESKYTILDQFDMIPSESI